MLFVANKMALVLVHAYLNILVIHIPDADQNVFKTLTVIDVNHASIINVLIRAQVHAEQMLNVVYKIIHQFVHAYLVTLVNHFQIAILYLKVQFFPN